MSRPPTDYGVSTTLAGARCSTNDGHPGADRCRDPHRSTPLVEQGGAPGADRCRDHLPITGSRRRSLALAARPTTDTPAPTVVETTYRLRGLDDARWRSLLDQRRTPRRRPMSRPPTGHGGLDDARWRSLLDQRRTPRRRPMSRPPPALRWSSREAPRRRPMSRPPTDYGVSTTLAGARCSTNDGHPGADRCRDHLPIRGLDDHQRGVRGPGRSGERAGLRRRP